MEGKLKISQIGELLVDRLAKQTGGCRESVESPGAVREATPQDLYGLGSSLGFHRLEIQMAIKFAASRGWILVSTLTDQVCLATVRPKGCLMLQQGGHTGILQMDLAAHVAGRA